MDFEKILHAARKNELHKKEPVKCLQTRFKPPTKEQRDKDRVLSEGVQKFLARKKEEEKQKQIEAERKKQELMALRAKDPKASKRVQTMLKRTKSANKSVMEDAVDVNNTADTLAGPSQPDEDDYGFVSESSSQLYNKLIQKMYSTPSDDQPKFSPIKKPNSSNLSNTKERVKMALLKQEEEEKLPHKRKRKGKERKEDEENGHIEYGAPDRDMSNVSSEREKAEPPKVRKNVPPPMDFHQLLKIAEQKQHEPIVFEPKEKRSEEPEVLMTKKQKLEHERMQEWKRRRELGLSSSDGKAQKDDKSVAKKIPKLKPPGSVPGKIPKLSGNSSGSEESSRQSSKPSGDAKGSVVKEAPKGQKPKPERIPKVSDKSDAKCKDINAETSRLIKERDEALRILKEKERLIRERDEEVRRLKEKEQLIRERDEAVRKLKMLEKAEKSGKAPSQKSSSPSLSSERHQKPASKAQGPAKSSTSTSDGKRAVVAKPNGASERMLATGKDASKPNAKSLPPQKVVPREFPPRDLKPDGKMKIRQFPPTDVKGAKQFPPGDVRRKQQPMKRRRIDSDDDEYDSELEDFIDDGEADVGPEDVSKVISEIFRYDKNRYARYDDDDECMESNFAQISKEEFFSTKCGILEDLQDIQKEKAAIARKKKR